MKRWIIAAALAATAAGAYAWCGDGAGYGPRGHWTGPDVQQSLANRNAALESILTLRDNQKQAFKDYTAAQEKAYAAMRDFRAKNRGQAYDRQSRLELSAEREKLLGQVHADVAAKRAALWKLLDPQQKMALEDYESRAFAGHGRFHQGPRHGWNCRVTPAHPARWRSSLPVSVRATTELPHRAGRLPGCIIRKCRTAINFG